MRFGVPLDGEPSRGIDLCGGGEDSFEWHFVGVEEIQVRWFGVLVWGKAEEVKVEVKLIIPKWVWVRSKNSYVNFETSICRREGHVLREWKQVGIHQECVIYLFESVSIIQVW